VKFVETIARNINKYRKVSIARLADKAGISKFTLQKILYAQTKDIQVSTLIKIAKALDVSLDKLTK